MTEIVIIIEQPQPLVIETAPLGLPGPPGPAGEAGVVEAVAPLQYDAEARRLSLDLSGLATAAQGTLADTAVQPGDLALVATSGSYADLAGRPVIPSTPEEVGADPAGTAAAAISTHEAAGDPHPQYTTSAEASAAAPVQSVASKTGAVTLISNDVGLGNVPNVDATARANHTGTQTLASISDAGNSAGLNVGTTTGTVAAGDHNHTGVYEPAGTASTEIANHEAAVDPHPQYTTVAEAAAAAPVQSVAGKTGAVTLAKGDVGLGNVPNLDATARANHTGTQLSSTISDLATTIANAITARVLNILTSTSTTDALSANQGKVLKDLVDGKVGINTANVVRFTDLRHRNDGQPIRVSTAQNQIANSVFPLTLGFYTDFLAHRSVTSMEYYNGASWVDWSAKIPSLKNALDGQPGTSFTTGDADPAKFRFVAEVEDVYLGVTLFALYQEPSNSRAKPYTLQVEYSADGVTGWVNIIAPTYVPNGDPITTNEFHLDYFPVHFARPEKYIRVSIEVHPRESTTGTSFMFFSMFSLKGRKGGAYRNLPFTWNYQKDLILGGGLIQKTPNGTLRRLVFNNDGTITTEVV